jgi:hypothetical protein
MITFTNAFQLAASLRLAEEAHKVSGSDADSWPEWYAHWIDAHSNGDPNPEANAMVRAFTY